MTASAEKTVTPAPHSAFEDVQGLLTGTLFVALALMMYREAGLVTGGTPGLAFLLHYPLGLPLGWVFFLINLPFYFFGWKVLGCRFTLKTFAAVGLVSLYVEWLPGLLGFSHLNPWFGAILAGLLTGAGILILIRHGASLGGVGIMAIFLQKRHGWRAGTVQMLIDAVILLLAFGLIEPLRILLSLLGAAALNLVIGVNHRNGRYFAA